jgi:hypothetical protein
MDPAAQPQVPLVHTMLAAQAWPQVPQLLALVLVLTQAPLQLVWPAGQEHLPFEHEAPLVQTTPQLPQLLLSVLVLKQIEPHCLKPAPLHEELHWPPVHEPLHAGAAQLPQCCGSVWTSTQPTPAHWVCPEGHSHLAPTQVAPPAHTFPHVPQSVLLVCRSTHPPSQSALDVSGQDDVPELDELAPPVLALVLDELAPPVLAVEPLVPVPLDVKSPSTSAHADTEAPAVTRTTPANR